MRSERYGEIAAAAAPPPPPRGRLDDGEVAFTMRSYLDPSVAGARLLATVDGVAYGVSAQRFD